MLDLKGLNVASEERELLIHPQVGGVILFSRNYASVQQLEDLVASIKQCNDHLLVAVDQEGGRVQRFRDQFLTLPPLRAIGVEYEKDREQGITAAKVCAWAMAAELMQYGVDISFAPVLDLFDVNSPVIKERAFSGDGTTVGEIGLAYIEGMQDAGMAATGKHFPGHGKVLADSHTELPTDTRSLEAIRENDLIPFATCIRSLDAIMPAHIVYPKVDEHCAGFSKVWIEGLLRTEFGFDGVVFSDDLTMNAAHSAGSVTERADLALAAGCDMVLVCNRPEQAAELVSYLDEKQQPGNNRIGCMLAKNASKHAGLYESDRWLEAKELISRLSVESA
ncbi:MAG: beta-N-acetylhexosaminidase [SAR86 cluster bacterium]|uniref:beta-N-acetylhexosaminidase n=1 Tax=SAR86 cluster bacterium TaxID=2030880 RepID=A0A2A4X8G6_9GAMM|nr:MAG: beta-N-acetylhexosaminidase [SAR86 cluster bacterium]